MRAKERLLLASVNLYNHALVPFGKNHFPQHRARQEDRVKKSYYNRQMSHHKPKPRSEYASHLKSLNGKCAFCRTDDELGIQNFDHWDWKFAAFPYRKLHTLIIPRRHVDDFSELHTHELTELTIVLKRIEQIYRNKGVISETSPYGDQLFISWRQRSESEGLAKKSVAHFHIHLFPRKNNSVDMTIDPEATEFDISLLKS
jgi:diadenosine tetraphosphate (Ap4A) HIT family hydrolase